MYVIERNASRAAWLCTTALETFSDAVQLRLQGKDKDFKVFEQRLNKGEHIKAGVISVYKCSEALNCSECTITSCKILKAVQNTIKASSDFAKWVEKNSGYIL